MDDDYFEHDSEASLREQLRWFYPTQLTNMLDTWRRKRVEILEELETIDEMDLETFYRFQDELEEVDTLSYHLSVLSDLLTLEMRPIQKRLDQYADEHPDEF